jgi:hypothetical protein
MEHESQPSAQPHSPAHPNALAPTKRAAQPAHRGPDGATDPTTPTARVRARGPLGHAPLRAHPLDDALEPRLDDDAADYNLGQRGVQGLEVEDEVELAHVFEHAVEGLDEDLDQVQQGERGLGRGRDDDEVQRRVVPVRHQRGRVVVARGGGGGGVAREKRRETGGERVSRGEDEVGVGATTYGRKLHDELGRFATSVKISEIRRCCTLVSWSPE